MAIGAIDTDAFSFSDFPEDVQLCILSFLSLSEISSFACTSKWFASLCRDDAKLWHAMCDRRWGSKTQVRRWGNGRISYKFLYKTLNDWENLIGLWRRCGHSNPATVNSPPLVFFEWGHSFVIGSRVSPLKDGTYGVSKVPFLYMGISKHGRVFNFLDLDGNLGVVSDFQELELFDGDFVPVNVNFMGNGHFLVEENRWFAYTLQEETKNWKSCSSVDESEEAVTGRSPKECKVAEMYTQFANRTSPGGERRSQRRKEKERLGQTKWEPEHFVKVVDSSPTPARPLQGLWKGLCDGVNLEFYFIKYDEVGGIICRKIGDLSSSRDTGPVFWTSNPTFVKSPFASEEEHIYNERMHLGPLEGGDHDKIASRMLYINSSYDLVLPGLVGSGGDSMGGEGRIWVYKNGTFGFGFLRDQFIIDLKHVVEDGCLVDAVITSG